MHRHYRDRVTVDRVLHRVEGVLTNPVLDYVNEVGYAEQRAAVCRRQRGDDRLCDVVVQPVERVQAGEQLRDPPPLLVQLGALYHEVRGDAAEVLDRAPALCEGVSQVGHDRNVSPTVPLVVHESQPGQGEFALPGRHELHLPLEVGGDALLLHLGQNGPAVRGLAAEHGDIRESHRPGGPVLGDRVLPGADIVHDASDNLVRLRILATALDVTYVGHPLRDVRAALGDERDLAADLLGIQRGIVLASGEEHAFERLVDDHG